MKGLVIAPSSPKNKASVSQNSELSLGRSSGIKVEPSSRKISERANSRPVASGVGLSRNTSQIKTSRSTINYTRQTLPSSERSSHPINRSGSGGTIKTPSQSGSAPVIRSGGSTPRSGGSGTSPAPGRRGGN